MTFSNLRQRLMQKIINKAESIIESKARTLTALLKYEIAVANTELAMRSKEHGYDFQFIPESYADSVVLGQTTSDNGQVTMTITIPQHAFKHASESEVAFFKTYVMANAVTKLRNGI